MQTNDLDGDNLTLTITTKPDWLTFTPATGELRGTPRHANVGEHNVVITAEDGQGGSATQSFTITVTDVNNAPTFTSKGKTTATENALYSYIVQTNDADGEDLTLTATTPNWLTFTPATGELRGTPVHGDVGTHDVEIKAKDGQGSSATQRFTIKVTDVNNAPTITSEPETTATENQSYSYIVKTNDLDGDIFFFKQKTAYEILSGLVGSEMCIRDRHCANQ